MSRKGVISGAVHSPSRQRALSMWSLYTRPNDTLARSTSGSRERSARSMRIGSADTRKNGAAPHAAGAPGGMLPAGGGRPGVGKATRNASTGCRRPEAGTADRGRVRATFGRCFGGSGGFRFRCRAGNSASNRAGSRAGKRPAGSRARIGGPGIGRRAGRCTSIGDTRSRMSPKRGASRAATWRHSTSKTSLPGSGCRKWMTATMSGGFPSSPVIVSSERSSSTQGMVRSNRTARPRGTSSGTAGNRPGEGLKRSRPDPQSARSASARSAIARSGLGNTILLGDSESTLAELPAESVDLVFTSPPYFNARPDYTEYEAYEEYLAKMGRIIGQCHRLLAEGRFFVINIAPVLLRRSDRSRSSRRLAVPSISTP